MALLRTKEMEEKHREYRRTHPDTTPCIICDKESLKSFQHWKIVNNDFPYDLIAKEHHMLVPIRHITEARMSNDELKELLDIKMKLLDPKYDFFIESAPQHRSLPSHFHLHLVVIKNI